jgi:membrane-bound serine protease (ClpP class)
MVIIPCWLVCGLPWGLMAVRWRFPVLLALLGICVVLRASGSEDPDTRPIAPATTAPAAVPMGGPAVIIQLAGEINDYNRDVLYRRFDKARAMGAKTIILDLNTYGGLVIAGRDISSYLKRQNDLHVIAYIQDKAISAGAMIAVACDEIVMGPDATLGDCAPILFDEKGLESLPPAERAKQESPIVDEFLDSARRNGYDPLLLESMVKVQVVVYYMQDDEGHKRFVDEDDYKKLTADGWKPVPGLPVPIDGPDTLLTVHTDEALKLGLARGEASSARELAGQRGYTVLAELTPTVGDDIISFLGSPWVRSILVLIFIQALIVGFSAPGHGAAEAIAVVSLGLLVGVPLLTGYAQWWDVLLIFGGLALVAFEIFVFPGHMVSAIVGFIMVLGGILLTFVGNAWSMPGSWQMPATWMDLTHGLYAVAGGLFCSILLSFWLRRYLPKLPYFNRLILTATSGGQAANSAQTNIPGPAVAEPADRWPFVGTVGRAVSDLKPGGSAQFPYADDTRTTAVISESGYITAGTKIVVREVSGSRVVVRKDMLNAES